MVVSAWYCLELFINVYQNVGHIPENTEYSYRNVRIGMKISLTIRMKF